MGRRKKKRGASDGGGSIELNVMPFVDVFSLLTTFLLFSAVFVQIGILEVQVPFLSNSNPPDMNKPSRDLEIKMDVRKEYIEIQTAYTRPPLNEVKNRYQPTLQGISEMHKRLVEIRQENIEADKITLFSDDDVQYETLTQILDATKYLREGDPVIQQPELKSGQRQSTQLQLFPKIIMGSVML